MYVFFISNQVAKAQGLKLGQKIKQPLKQPQRFKSVSLTRFPPKIQAPR